MAAALTLSACQVASEPQAEPDPDVTQVGSTQTPDGEDEFVYVAMGDSYTAAPLFPLAEQEQINGCLRSDENYPALVATRLDVPLIDVSCSGASTTSMFAAQRFIDNERPPQLDSLTTVVIAGESALIGATAEILIASVPYSGGGVDLGTCKTRVGPRQ